MHFFCKDSVGHAVVEVKLRSDACKGMGEVESVALRVPIQAAAIDSFVADISYMDMQQIGRQGFAVYGKLSSSEHGFTSRRPLVIPSRPQPR